jgi:hypothetical protein
MFHAINVHIVYILNNQITINVAPGMLFIFVQNKSPSNYSDGLTHRSRKENYFSLFNAASIAAIIAFTTVTSKIPLATRPAPKP